MTPLRMRWIPTRPGRRRESAIAWPLVLLAALACRPRPASEPPPTTEAPPAVVEAPPAPRSDPELVAIADAIDPGEVAPMIEGMPERLRSSLERMYPAYTPVEELEALARDDLAAYLNFRGGPPEVETLALLRLGRAVYLGERLLLAGRDDAELLALLQTAYTYLDRPYFTREAGFFRGSFPSIVERAAKAGVIVTQSQMYEVKAALTAAFARADALRRRSAARILRGDPDQPALPEVLNHVAAGAERLEDFAGAVALLRVAIARAQPPTSRLWAELAGHCYTALDLACGDEARDRSAALTPEGDERARADHEARLVLLAERRAAAAELVALQGKEGIDVDLRRGHLDLLLGRYGDAERLYLALREQSPRDARPYAGLAKLVIDRERDFEAAISFISAGRGLENRDRDFFEISLGLSSSRLFAEVVPKVTAGGSASAALGPFLRDVRDDVQGLGRSAPARAAVLRVLDDAVEKVLPALLAGQLRDARPVLRRLLVDLDRVRVADPTLADAWHATLAATTFSDDPARARAVASAPLPPALADDDALQLARHRCLRSLAITWEAPGAADELDAAIALLPERLRGGVEALETRALALALRAQAGDDASLEPAIDGYRALAGRIEGSARGRALTNAAVLLARRGDAAAANAAYLEAADAVDAKGHELLLLARIAAAPSVDRADDLDRLAASTQSSAIRLHARAWRAELARRAGGQAAETFDAAYRAAVAHERDAEIRGHLPIGRLGVAVTGRFHFALQYSVRRGLEPVFQVDGDAWLVPAAPLTQAIGERSSAKRPPAK